MINSDDAAQKYCNDCERPFIVDNSVCPTPQLACPYCHGENVEHVRFIA